MGTTLNRHAYERLIEENIEWLLKQPRTLERDHIEAVLRVSPDREYGPRTEVVPKDNWSLIVKRYAPLIGRKYKDHRGEYVFFGLVHADDDYYYGLMGENGQMILSSCVGSLEHMFEEAVPSPQLEKP